MSVSTLIQEENHPSECVKFIEEEEEDFIPPLPGDTEEFIPPLPEEDSEGFVPPLPEEFVPPPPEEPEELLAATVELPQLSEQQEEEEHSVSEETVPPLPEEEDVPPPPEEEYPERKQTRWSDASVRLNIAPVHTILPGSMSGYQLEQFLVQARLEEIAKRLRTGDVLPAGHERSPSPPPAYDAYGRRTNMRESRYRKRLEDERQKLVEIAFKNNPAFRVTAPHLELQRRQQLVEKVWIPTIDFPHVNFVGLLIGPRGNELRKMEQKSGAKISIRGKGAVKEGKTNQPGADEELHAYITGDSEEKIKTAVDLVNRIVEIAVSTPESENELKKQQLRELAEINGTFRSENQDICSNCGAFGHRKFDCLEQRNFTVSLVCNICGGVGHLPRDCIGRNDPTVIRASMERQNRIQSEYMHFMSQINK